LELTVPLLWVKFAAPSLPNQASPLLVNVPPLKLAAAGQTCHPGPRARAAARW
jgi:hypothetical protein